MRLGAIRPDRALFIISAVTLFLLGAAAAALAPFGIAHVYLLRQDIYILGGLIVVLLAGGMPAAVADRRLPAIRLGWPLVLVSAFGAVLLLWAGSYLLFSGYPLSRDEHMAVFDAAIYRTGRLAMPLAPEWRPYIFALVPEFLLPIPGRLALVSAYMPVNSVLRAGFGEIADPALLAPLLIAGGGVALYDVSRRLFAEAPAAQAISLILYASSAQVIVTAMTPFAMTGHLALNLAWLSLYLRDTWRSHLGAIALGFLGIGLHQIVFHPLFALPFIALLWFRAQRTWAISYVVAYALFALFWISYQHWVILSVGATAVSPGGSSAQGFLADRIVPLLLKHDRNTFGLMAANLVRFVSWQNLSVVPLVLLSIPAMVRGDGIARALAAGILLTIGAMAFLLPYQGHGWGYRYLHGCIGSIALLAAYGWRDFGGDERLRRFTILAMLATFFWSLPFLCWQAARFVRPYAAVNSAIDQTKADIVIVETDGLGFPLDLVRNDPALQHRPIRLASTMLRPADAGPLCRLGTIAFFSNRQIQALGVGSDDDRTSRQFQQLRASATCKVQSW